MRRAAGVACRLCVGGVVALWVVGGRAPGRRVLLLHDPRNPAKPLYRIVFTYKTALGGGPEWTQRGPSGAQTGASGSPAGATGAQRGPIGARRGGVGPAQGRTGSWVPLWGPPQGRGSRCGTRPARSGRLAPPPGVPWAVSYF